MTYRSLICAALLTLCPACEDESGDDESMSASDTSDATGTDGSSDASSSESTQSGDGDGDGSSGDGDGDATSGDGDGDTSGGDGDGDAALGEQLWVEGGHMQRCGMCHLDNGQYPPEALASALSEAEIFDQIVNGGEVMTPQVPDELTQAEAAHIAAYLFSLNGG